MSSVHIVAIVKPTDPRIMSELSVALARVRAAGHDVSLEVTSGPGAATFLAGRAVERGADLLIAVGGDGTVNGVVSGLMQSGVRRPRLAVIPMGTANDFARGRGIPADVDGALDVALNGRASAMDVACANGRWFINVSTGGFGASATQSMGGAWKRRLGGLAYLLSGARRLWRLRAERARFAVDGDVVHDGAFVFYAVANGERTGGGTPVAPYADVRDGCLDLTIVRTSSRGDFIRLLPQLRAGTHVAHPDVLYTRGGRIQVHARRRLQVNLDGEPMHAADIHYALESRSLRVMLPALTG